jgi:beta-fructofuranosidase
VNPEDYAMPFDPNGAIFWEGRYHLFYIYQERGVHQFGHVSSLDMVHWRHHPPAVFPTPDSPETGIFSGNCFVNKKGEATMVYHGVGAGNCVATSTDELLDHWVKLPTNPFVPFPSEGAPYRARDPHGWLEGDTYYAISGGERPALFKSKDLARWSYVGDLMPGAPPGLDPREDHDLSCPDLFKLGNKRVLVCISHNRGARYYVGEWKGEQFHPEVHERLSWSDHLYFAPESLEGPRGRRILWAWIFDQRPEPMRKASGWSGEMALPRDLTLGPDNRLRMRPIKELERLRYDRRALGPFELRADAERPLAGVSGDALELLVEVEPRGARQVGVRVLRSPDGSESTPVALDLERKRLVVSQEAGPFAPAGESVTLRIFLDRSVVEAFADDRQAVVRRVYPTRPDRLGVSLFADGGAARVRRVVVWKMFPSNPY